MSYLYENFIDTECNLTLVKSGYVKGVCPALRDYDMEGNFITLNMDVRELLDHFVATPELGPSKKETTLKIYTYCTVKSGVT